MMNSKGKNVHHVPKIQKFALKCNTIQYDIFMDLSSWKLFRDNSLKYKQD